MQELHHETASQWVDMIHHSPWFNAKHFASPKKTDAARRNSLQVSYGSYCCPQLILAAEKNI